eukprot:TRINITY_DN19863_c0_g1_i1.p1 TRINITY_DN19863_c0_g1~~TRINITY_DN19863_c0_g1_i1.p1  ORF type:complete len:580 (-),score=114.61 TRINITY_DN19863_c0_g1_i1:58-1734(-)
MTTLWKDGGLVESDFQFDIAEILSLFARTGKAQGDDGDEDDDDDENGAAEGSSKPAPVVRPIISARRSQNVCIMLFKWKLPSKEIAAKIRSLDPKFCALDNLVQLRRFFPDQDETKELLAVPEAARHLLSTADKYFLALLLDAGPDPPQQINLLYRRATFFSTAKSSLHHLAVAQKAMVEVRLSKRWRTFLALVLKFGNVLNAGTRRGRCYGFRIASVLRMIPLKAYTDMSFSALHYIAQICMDSNNADLRDVLELKRDFVQLKAMQKLGFGNVRGEVKELCETMQIFEMEAVGEGNLERFEQVYQEMIVGFHTKGEMILRKVQDREKVVIADASSLLTLFGEGDNPKELDDFVGVVWSIVEAFDKCVRQISETRRIAQEQAEMLARREKMVGMLKKLKMEHSARNLIESAVSPQDKVMDKLLFELATGVLTNNVNRKVSLDPTLGELSTESDEEESPSKRSRPAQKSPVISTKQVTPPQPRRKSISSATIDKATTPKSRRKRSDPFVKKKEATTPQPRRKSSKKKTRKQKRKDKRKREKLEERRMRIRRTILYSNDD